MDEVANFDRFLPALRARVLATALNISAIAMPVLAAVLALQALHAGRMSLRTSLMCGFTALFPALRLFASRLDFRTTGLAFLGLVLLAAFLVQVRGGVTASAAALELIVVVLSCLLFGRAGAALGLCASMACYTLAAWLVLGGHATAIELDMWNPLLGEVWLRSGLALLFFGGTAVLAVLYMVQQLEHEARLLRATLGREQRERLRREQAESEREHMNRALSEAHRMEALGRLAGGVAHDFNNLLTVIVSASHYALAEKNVSRLVRDSLEEINHAADRAAALTRELLGLGRKDSARPVVIEIAVLFKRLQTTLRRLLPADIELVIQPGVAGAVEIDPVRLERVLLNLVINARDAINGSGRILLASAVQQPASAQGAAQGVAPGTFVALSVEDNGRGMDDGTRQHLFEPFFTTKPSGKGSGLGLSMVQSFVADAGGKVQVDSDAGKGSRVTLYLPVAVPSVAPQNGHAPLPGPLEADRGGSVLVVENDASVRAAIVHSLVRAGFTVHEAEDGDAGLELLADETLPLDLLCIDGVLPGASSRTLIERARSRKPAVGVVVCSGYIGEELVRRGIQADEIVCVRKPFTPVELVECIKSQLPAVAAPLSS